MTGAAVHRVVIVGGGFGGLFAAKFLRRAPVEVTLIDARNYHLFQPLLYQLATGILSAGEVAPPIRDVLRRHGNVSVVMATVTELDLAARTVTAQAARRDGSAPTSTTASSSPRAPLSRTSATTSSPGSRPG